MGIMSLAVDICVCSYSTEFSTTVLCRHADLGGLVIATLKSDFHAFHKYFSLFKLLLGNFLVDKNLIDAFALPAHAVAHFRINNVPPVVQWKLARVWHQANSAVLCLRLLLPH